MEDLQDGWERRESRSKPGQLYYIHPESGKTQWEAPLKKRRLQDTHEEEKKVPQQASVDGGLFSGLPEASSVTCDPKTSLAEGPPKPVTHVRALHLLKKHTGSRRPSSWREKVIKRTLEEATHDIKQLRKQIAAGKTDEEQQAEFERLAKEESDRTSAHEGGSLGRFGRGKMQPAFEQAAFALKVNELSGIVTSDSGVHIILRVE